MTCLQGQMLTLCRHGWAANELMPRVNPVTVDESVELAVGMRYSQTPSPEPHSGALRFD